MKEELLGKRENNQLVKAGANWEAEKDARPRRRARGLGQWASSPAIPPPVPGELGIPLASLSLGFLLGKVALAMRNLWAAQFLEVSLMLTLLDPVLPPLSFPPLHSWWLHLEPLPLLGPTPTPLPSPAHPPDPG